MFGKGRIAKVLVAAVCAFSLAATASADLDIPKWTQQPDVTITSLDVDATTTPLADDFLCFEPEPITDVHIWGSWLDDAPEDIRKQTAFQIAFYHDIPADPTGGVPYSRPDYDAGPIEGKVFLFQPGEYQERLWKRHAAPFEGWYSPQTGEYIDDNHQEVWQYNFLIPESEAVFQEGTQEQPIAYWLEVQALVPTDAGGAPQGMFGWKTSYFHWNDDAVWVDSADGAQELRYPNQPPYIDPAYSGAPVAGDSIDLAFAITPEPATMVLLGLGGVGLVLRRRRKA